MTRKLKVFSFALALWLSHQVAGPVSAAVTRIDECDVGAKCKLPVYQWHNDSAKPKAIVVGIHGLTFYAEAFDDFARYMATQGYEFFAVDIRGFGRWKADYAKYGSDGKIHFTDGETDLASLLRTIKTEYPGERIYLLGESLGANEALLMSEQNPSLFDGAILSSPCIKACLHPRVRWIPDFIHGLIHPRSPINIEPYLNSYLSNDKSLTEACLRDPKINRSFTPSELIKSNITLKKPLKNVGLVPEELPMLIVAGDKDAVFRADVVPKFVTGITSQKVDLVVLKNKGHLMIEHQPVQKEISSVVLNWLDAQTAEPQTVVNVHATKVSDNQVTTGTDTD